MYSPSKSYSLMTQNHSQQNIISFKQQTLSILRQQSQKMKQLNAYLSSKDEQLMIKEQQIKFLKQTIKQLEIQNQAVIMEKNQAKMKLDKIIEQVNNYNENVVKLICIQREQLKQINFTTQSLNQQLSKLLFSAKMQINTMEQQNLSLQKQLTQLHKQIKDYQLSNFQLQQKLSKQQKTSEKQSEQILKLTSMLTAQSSKRQKLQVQVNALNKQLNNVVGKHNSTIKQYEQKLSDLNYSKIDVSEVKVYQELVKNKEKQIQVTKNQIITTKRVYEEFKCKSLSEKDKLLKQLTQTKLRLSQFVTDLTNLKKSIQLKRRIVEFESQSSQLFYSLYQIYENNFDETSQLKEKYQQALKVNHKLISQVEKLSQSLKDVQIQQILMKTQLHQELQRLQSTYEGKLITLNLKIRKQQQALERLKKRQLQAMEQNQQLYQQLESTRREFDVYKSDFTAYKETTEKSLSNLNVENYKILGQMQQLYKICEESFDNKRIVDTTKHVIHALLTGVYYLQLKLIRFREKQRKLYMPLLDFYLQFSKKLTNIDTKVFGYFKNENESKSYNFPILTETKPNAELLKKSNPLRKLRVSVWTIIASIRIGKTIQKSNSKNKIFRCQGLKFKLLKAIDTRNKIHNMTDLLQKQTQIICKEQEIQQTISSLIDVYSGSFTWIEPNFSKLALNSSQYLMVLDRVCNMKAESRKGMNQQ